ncbi:MAG: PRC-barrel domain-containing protein [Dehalococcoidia bacterium]
MTTYDSSATGPLEIGCPVYTADGDEIGHVKEVRGRVFKVDAPLRPDYWLSRESIGATRSNGVTLIVDKDHLGDAKVAAPEDIATETHQVAAGADMPAREGLLTSYPPNTPVGLTEIEVSVTGAPAGEGRPTS